MGQSAVVPQNDRASLPGSEGGGHSGDYRRRWHARPRRRRKFLGKVGPGGRGGGGSGLSGRVGGAGSKEKAAGGNHSSRLRLRVRGRREVLQRVRSAGGADRRR